MISKPQYFSVVKQADALEKGTLVLAWQKTNKRIEVSNGEEDFYYTPAEFQAHFEPCPEGEQAIQAKLQSLFSRIHALPLPNTDTQLALPGATATGSQTLVTTQQRNGLIEAKQATLQAQKQVGILKTQITKALALQQKALDLMQATWAGQLEQISYAISSINLYLGRDEEIVCIQEGEPAPKQEPITIRQTVLYMDEETALNCEEGGLDFATLEDFDRWVCKPENLKQLLPESKGILGMKLRRENKFYANEAIWEQIMLQMANGGTYILVRNGDKLWRIWNEIDIPEHLFPTQDEFNALFYDQWRDEPIKPGTQAYQQALDAASGMQRRYLQIVLLLQGLIDRTKIFHPLVTTRVNLLDPNPDPTVIKLIRDAENLLADGKLNYAEWYEKLNSTLEPGKRIVFGGTDYQRYQYESHKDKYSLTIPKFSDWPVHSQLYTIKDVSKEEELYFSYAPPTGRKQATFHFQKHYPFILNFDDLTVPDLQYYLNDRRHRHHYLESYPILRAALALKLKEEQAEKPFIDLLVKEASKAHPGKIEPLIIEVIRWWKQKNRVVRSLTERENLAYRQILAEVTLRTQIQSTKVIPDTIQYLDHANLLVLAKDTGKTITRLITYSNITGLVRKETFDLVGRPLKQEDWVAPGHETDRWEILKASPAWESWPKHGRRQDFLSEPEVQELWDQLQSKLKADTGLKNLVAVTQDNESLYVFGTFTSYYSKHVDWECHRWQWQRVKGGFTLTKESHLSTTLGEGQNTKTEDTVEFDYEKEHVRRLTPETRRLPFSAFGSRILLFDQNQLAKAATQIQKQAHQRQKESNHRSQIHDFCEQVQTEIEKRFWKHEHNKYLQDGGLQELWNDHKKTVKPHILKVHETDLPHILESLARNHNLKGLSLGEIFSLANEAGIELEKPAGNKVLPADIRLS